MFITALNIKPKYIVFALFCLLLAGKVSAQQVRFVPNKGQWQDEVLYKADIPGGDLYVTKKGLVYNLYDEQAVHHNQHNGTNLPVKAHAIFLNFIQPSSHPVAAAYDFYSTSYNYFLGNDKSKWKSNVKACKKVMLRNIYPYIDFEITGVEGGVKTAFIVRNGGDRSRIKWEYKGANGIAVSDDQLTIRHSLGNIIELPPVSYFISNGNSTTCTTKYTLHDSVVGYDVSVPDTWSGYDSLVIDPSIVFSSFSGSVADNFGFTSTFDKNGNAYGGGTVYSVGFPTKAGSYQVDFGGGINTSSGGAKDAGILKFSPDGKQLLYATYLGGNKNEQPHSMSCDASGNLFVMGTTLSANFPVKSGYDMSHNGGYDVFVVCLNPTGSDLISGTFIGGKGNDGINGTESGRSASYPTNFNYGDCYRGDIRLDDAGNAYIATVTQSSSTTGELPIINATQSVFGGGLIDGWVVKLNSNLSQLLFSSFIGGSSVDAAYSIRISGNNFYVAGGTTSADMPLSQSNPAAFSYKGGVDGFLAKFTQTGNNYSLGKTIYLGTPAYDQNYFVSTDNAGKVYVMGQTASTFPKIGNVYYETGGKHFVSILDADLASIEYQTVFGVGNGPKLSPSAFMVDKCDKIYISGWGGQTNKGFNNSTDFITGLKTTSDAYQSTTDGSDFYLVIFNRDLGDIDYATYFGGPVTQEHVDGGTSHFNEEGVVYQSVCAGCGGLSDFPTTPDAYSRTNKGLRPNNPGEGGCNNAVFKFDAKPDPKPPVMTDTVLSVTITDTLDYFFHIIDLNNDSIVIVSIESPLLTLSSNPAKVIVVNNVAGNITLRLRWFSDCSAPVDTFYIAIKYYEISCGNINIKQGTIKVIVKNIPITSIDLNCLKRVGDNILSISWSPVLNTRYLKRINIYRNVNGTTFDSLASISKPFVMNQTADVVLHAETNNYCYRLSGVNRCELKSSYSRQSCSLDGDTLNPGAYHFSRDTIWYIKVLDTLNAELVIKDNEFSDSMYINYAGALLSDPKCMVKYNNGVGEASIKVNYTTGCDGIGDTLELNFGVRDNQCPSPLRDYGKLRIVVLPPAIAPSVNLQCLKNFGNNKVGLRWLNADNSSLTSRYHILKKTENGVISDMGQQDVMWSEFIALGAPDPFTVKHCFALVSYNFCDQPSDTGDFNCTPWADSLYPAALYPHYVSVVGNKDIEISWKHNDALYNQLYKVNSQLTSKELLHQSDSETDTIWIDDKGVNVHKQSYCYMVETTNACGLKPKHTPVACSVLLKGESKPFEHNMTWNEYAYFNEGTSGYDIFARDYTEKEFAVKGNATFKNTNFFDDKLNKETGLFYYQVYATEHNSAYFSLSNTIELKQKPLLHIPNAYTANNDGLNDSWNIVPAFVKDYHMKLYDRWGKLVFETIDKHKQVELADMYGELLPIDVYAYVITFTGFNGEAFTRTGNVTILK